MIGPRFVAALALGLAVTSVPEAKVRCPEEVRLRTCIGVAADDTVRFCFASDLGCTGTGVVLSLDPPSEPFSVTRLRVQGALGTRTIGPAAFPLTLLPGESLLVDVSATLTQASDVERTLELTLANTLPDGGDDDPMGKNEGDVCDVKLRVLGYEHVGTGIEDACLVNPACAFRAALLVGATRLFCEHNHPSGDPEPSPEDRTLYGRLRDAAKLLGLELTDFLVLGGEHFVSFHQRGSY